MPSADPPPAAAQSEGAPRPRRTSVVRGRLSSDVRLGIAQGIDFLIVEQARTGGFKSSQYPVAVNALAGLALLAGGNTEEAGSEKCIRALRDCTAELLKYQQNQGYFADARSQMYGHGFATLYLAELYGMSGYRSEELREALRRAIRVIERSQHADGGWDYQPAPQFGGSGPQQSDTSITVCQTMALRAARNLGLSVDALVIRSAERYIRDAQTPDGGFRYRSRGVAEMIGSAFARSAAGVCVLYSLGDYSSSAIRSGLRYLEAHYKDSSPFPFYAHYYCSQALFQAGGPRWQEYYDWVSARLLQSQERDGSWRAGVLKMERDPVQTTAMALIVLQLPLQLLPIHER